MAYYKEKEFDDWLADNYPSSAPSYKSGVGSFINWIDSNKSQWKNPSSLKVKNFEDYLRDTKEMSERDTLFSAALNILQKEIQKAKKNISPSIPITTLQNYKSFLSAYEEFLRSEPFEPKAPGIKQNHLSLLRKNSSNATYTRDELIKEFTNRILTQDRISLSKEILFPIRLIRKLWKADAEAWANDVCNNIWLILQSYTPVKTFCQKQIKDIETLSIKRNGEVIVTINNALYTLCTSYSDPHEYLKVNCNRLEYYRKRKPVFGLNCIIPTGGYIIDKNQNVIDSVTKRIVLWHIKPVKIKALGDIAIDHDIPISLVLKEKKKKLTELKKISKAYCDISATNNLSVTAANANKFCSKLNASNVCTFRGIGYPQADMSEIGKCKLVLMEKVENSMKSDS